LVTYRHNWGENRVYFCDGQGRLKAVPAEWTDVFPPDPFIVIAGGRGGDRMINVISAGPPDASFDHSE
jgi:hypothetical protein